MGGREEEGGRGRGGGDTEAVEKKSFFLMKSDRFNLTFCLKSVYVIRSSRVKKGVRPLVGRLVPALHAHTHTHTKRKRKKEKKEVEEKHQCDILLCQCKLFAVENKVCESLAAISYRVNSDMIAFLIELLC